MTNRAFAVLRQRLGADQAEGEYESHAPDSKSLPALTPVDSMTPRVFCDLTTTGTTGPPFPRLYTHTRSLLLTFAGWLEIGTGTLSSRLFVASERPWYQME